MTLGTSPFRFGLCCKFEQDPSIRFRTTTARYLSKLGREAGLQHREALVKHNAQTLLRAIRACQGLGIGAFRVPSGIIPLATHPDWRFQLERLTDDAVLAPIE